VAYSTYEIFEASQTVQSGMSATDSFWQPGHISAKRPIILDESYTPTESTALHEEGYEESLVERVDSTRNLMSAYGKPPLPGPQNHGNGKLPCSILQSLVRETHG
jgi:hypothetical protein